MAKNNSTKRHHRFKDLTGQRFGKWTVLQVNGQDKHGNYMWICRCECGTEAVINGTSLRRGASTQCFQCARTRHGLSKSPEYSVWHDMIARCSNTRNKRYRHYGGRGIQVCQSWKVFANFYADMGERPSNRHTIERVDNSLGYCKENCKWATNDEQARNTRRTRLLTFNGITMCILDWSKKTGISKDAIGYRIRTGWSVEDALTTPVQPGKSHAKQQA